MLFGYKGCRFRDCGHVFNFAGIRGRELRAQKMMWYYQLCNDEKHCARMKKMMGSLVERLSHLWIFLIFGLYTSNGAIRSGWEIPEDTLGGRLCASTLSWRQRAWNPEAC